MFRQEVDAVVFCERTAQCVGEDARVDSQFLRQKPADEVIHAKRPGHSPGRHLS